LVDDDIRRGVRVINLRLLAIQSNEKKGGTVGILGVRRLL
jgi:hypothetical protein